MGAVFCELLPELALLGRGSRLSAENPGDRAGRELRAQMRWNSRN